MAESENLAGRIEKLIVDGNKEVVDRVEKRLVEAAQEFRAEIRTVDSKVGRLEDGQRKILEIAEKIDKKQEANAGALYDLLKDARKDIKRVEDKLDEHMRLPVHAGV